MSKRNMSYIVRLDGRSVHHEGNRVGQVGKAEDGRRILVIYSDQLYDEDAFTVSEGILEKLDKVQMIGFRDTNHNLTVFESDHFYRVMNGDTNHGHYYLHPDKYNMDDKQIAVGKWNKSGFYKSQGEGFEFKGGKYEKIEDEMEG